LTIAKRASTARGRGLIRPKVYPRRRWKYHLAAAAIGKRSSAALSRRYGRLEAEDSADVQGEAARRRIISWLADLIAGNPNLDIPGLVAVGDPDLEAALLVLRGYINGLGAGGLNYDNVFVALLVADCFFDGGNAANLIAGGLDLDLVGLPLVMAGLNENLLGTGLVIAGDVAAVTARVEAAAISNAEPQA
jgi:hypothetical protein